MSETNAAPAGWYPVGDGTERYWNGTSWQADVRPLGAVASPPAAPPPAAAYAAAPPPGAAYAAAPYAAAPQAVVGEVGGVKPPSSALPIVALVTGILWISIVAIVVGHIALSGAKKYEAAGGRFDGRNTTYMRGAYFGMTWAGLILGYVGAIGWVLFWIFVVGAAMWAGSTVDYYDMG